MNHQSLTQRLFRYVPALFTLAALGLVGWAVVDRPAPSTTAAAVSVTTTSVADSPSSAVGADVRRRIEDVRVGDLVWAYDEQTGQLEKRPVTVLFRSQTDHLRVLTLESGSGERQRIETTDEHPFWVDGYGWQDAQLLRPGDRLLEPDQSHVTVISSFREEHPDGLTVYNFEVAGLHDYFVSATATDSLVLSHNMCRTGGGQGTRPPSLTPEGAGRTGALREALRNNDVPTSKQPNRVLPNVDKRNNPQPGRIYEYDIPAAGGGTKTVRIRDDAGGHDYGPGNTQNRGPHFNDERGNHYDY